MTVVFPQITNFSFDYFALCKYKNSDTFRTPDLLKMNRITMMISKERVGETNEKPKTRRNLSLMFLFIIHTSFYIIV